MMLESRVKDCRWEGQTVRPELKISGIAQSLTLMLAELRELTGHAEPLVTPAQAPVPAPAPKSRVARAKQIYRNRRRREQAFGDTSLFGEPAWDIMLDLYVAAAQGKRIAVTSACIGSSVPSTTALRWLKILEERGLIERDLDQQDARRSFVLLSHKGRQIMDECLDD